jgi:hypothetical protein
MTRQLRPNWRLHSLILIAALAAYLEHRWRAERAGDALEIAVVGISNGTTVAEVVRRLGGSPDEVTQEKGVLVDGVTFSWRVTRKRAATASRCPTRFACGVAGPLPAPWSSTCRGEPSDEM